MCTVVFLPGYGNVVNIVCRKSKEDFLRKLARDNTQLLFNAIWKVRSIPCTSIVNQTFWKQTQHQPFVRVWFQSQLNSVLVLKTGKACVYWSTCISQALKTCRWFSTPVLQKIKSLEIKHSIEVVCPIIFVRVQFQLIFELNWAESMDWVWFKI